jgi:hypothetical protein
MTEVIRTTRRGEKIKTGRLATRGLAAGALAIAANLLVYTLVPAISGISLDIPVMGPGSPVGPLPFSMVIVATALPTAGATLFLAILTRYSEHPVTIFRIVAGVLLLLSFGAPLSLPVSLGVRMTLASMHVLTAAIIVALLTASARTD